MNPVLKVAIYRYLRGKAAIGLGMSRKTQEVKASTLLESRFAFSTTAFGNRPFVVFARKNDFGSGTPTLVVTNTQTTSLKSYNSP